MSSTLLITGGNGFLGTHVKKAFKDADNFHLLTPRSTELNLLDFHSTSSFLRAYRPNVICNLAAICGGIGINSKNPAVFLRDNTQMALNIYEAARQNDITCIYSLGTVCMYPKFCPVPFKEEDIWNGCPELTNSYYSQGKRTLLMLGQAYRQQFGFTGAHLVPANMFGEFDHFDLENSHVIPALIRKFVFAVDNNLPEVECWGSGKDGATRTFLYAKDLAELLVKAISTNFDYNDPINVGTSEEISIFDLAHLIARLVGFSGSIVFNGKLDGQPRRCLDTTRAKALLNWQAPTSLEDGLKQTIAWYQENKQEILARG